MVLLKAHSPRDFVFYTSFESRMAGDLFANSRAALLFHWKSLRRQVRIEGAIECVGDGEADRYAASGLVDWDLFAALVASGVAGGCPLRVGCPRA